MVKEEYYCVGCGERINQNEKCCKKCGCYKRHIEVTINENIETHDQNEGKRKKGGAGEPAQKFKVGDDFFRKDGIWTHREMYVDKENNLYSEVIKNKNTGKIIRLCKEPLSKHIGHGYAKKRYSKNN